ncbi:threonine aldolase family protein [Mameliella alba]|uniref:threonine aldolase family protein n=1 Tax=Mameliella alba TaxID=561184 RepID=UPI000B53079F|nr:beta-eliminating lyase-related protein [Mameliella alba]MBY6118004.1 low specificity L-threonine aldolase [Mameliella alba]OWV44254.1 low specificity L-threonine aldolase [Mameliella alba]OWV63897.1 low specificity L-threonine aldolase [Mameliella alba]
MNFASDNASPVPQQVLDVLARVNSGAAASYGADDVTAEVADRVRALFEAPGAAVYLVATGTAANSLSLATLCAPFQTIFCSEHAHIHEDECNAPEFYTGGAKLTLVRGGDVMTPEALRSAILGEGNRGVHGPQRGPVSITNVTEGGNVYTLSDIGALCAVAREYGLSVHLDGARFANACVKLGCTPAEMTWKAGVDIAVFGGTKNGLMDAEAVVIFDPEAPASSGFTRAQEFELRVKRAGHLYSKHRYVAAQMLAYLEDDLWRDLAQQANDRCETLARGLQDMGLEIVNKTRANMLFFRAPLRAHKAAQAAGAVYALWGNPPEKADEPALARLVCNWSTTEAEITEFLKVMRAAL